MTDEKFLVVLGLDSEKKPHAARFSFVDEKAVNKAAGTKGFKIGIAKTKEAAAIVAKLIEGKIFDSGRGLVPPHRGNDGLKFGQGVWVDEQADASGDAGLSAD